MCIQPDRKPINQSDLPPLILVLPTTPTPSHRQHPYSLRYPTASLTLDLTIDTTSKLALLHPTTFHQRSLHLYRTGDHPQPTPPPTPHPPKYTLLVGVRGSAELALRNGPVPGHRRARRTPPGVKAEICRARYRDLVGTGRLDRVRTLAFRPRAPIRFTALKASLAICAEIIQTFK